MLADHRDGLSSSSFLAWSSIAQSVCQQAFSLLVNRYLRPWVRILPSAEVDNLSPFDSNIACLCQSIEINNNKYVCMYVCMYVCVYYEYKTDSCIANIYIEITVKRSSPGFLTLTLYHNFVRPDLILYNLDHWSGTLKRRGTSVSTMLLSFVVLSCND